MKKSRCKGNKKNSVFPRHTGKILILTLMAIFIFVFVFANVNTSLTAHVITGQQAVD